MPAPTSITLDTDIAQETLIALRDRYYQLDKERTAAKADGKQMIVDIIDRQQFRVAMAISAIASKVGE